MSILEINIAVFPTFLYCIVKNMQLILEESVSIQLILDLIVWKYLQLNNSTFSFIYNISWTFVFLVDGQGKLRKNFIAKYSIEKHLWTKLLHNFYIYKMTLGSRKRTDQVVSPQGSFFIFFLLRKLNEQKNLRLVCL
jgi:hypothetical protein